MAQIKNILLDRDGTVIVDKHYLSDPEGVELIPDGGRALAALQQAEMRMYVVTNQSGIGRGYFTEDDLHACTVRLDELAELFGAIIEDTVFCPHTPDEECDCRKPQTGMWNQLKDMYGLLPQESVMIGDKQADVDFGKNAGLAASILVLTGKGEKERQKLELPEVDEATGYVTVSTENGWTLAVAKDLTAAARWVAEVLVQGDK
ncbi:D-glycero-alpha-D-manno-heptose-1,7-bisphosphate 7-phosphatase [Halodesulfovibrio marinisediminis]|uniref:D,D-heptose 1,7-bisphosphate phosphatase n=1 Tax=Halodesulfovibrio marinisediminis DSM 17456 TaxID=1121457 RepID=A0A1N6IC38_9BACT|nr:HAD family hydrolase [Halodesulfovibrio marinisediminis]SIO29584.1 D-glycero-D-manno-heptose 1,7-bisphosphate phosphatase [Halodesulfovibrio marinisediminis DSM 17456]